MNCLILGFGEVGQGVYEAFKDYHNMEYTDLKDNGDVYSDDWDKMFECLENGYDLLLICFPYSDTFVEDVKKYQKEYEHKAVIIFSTVPIGTTRQIPNAVHCPIEGKHPNLAESILKFTRVIGGIDPDNSEEFYQVVRFFNFANILPRLYRDPEVTELAKLQSTTNYGINIEYARELKKVCDKYNVPYEAIKEYNRSYNKLYEGTDYKRYILDPPEGKIGGHCILQNLPLFKKDFNNKFIEILEENNE